MTLIVLNSDEWKKMYSEVAHRLCFNEKIDPSHQRLDFALLTIGDDGLPCSYMTCREDHKDLVYMQYGGSFPSAKDSIKSFKSYSLMIEHLAKNYRIGRTLIENTNQVMIKFAMKVGFKITGCRYFEDSILLENTILF